MSGGEFLSFVLSSAVRTDDNQNAAMLLCCPLTGSIEDQSTATANPKAIVHDNVGRGMIGFPKIDFDNGCRNQYGRRTPQPWRIWTG